MSAMNADLKIQNGWASALFAELGTAFLSKKLLMLTKKTAVAAALPKAKL